MKFVLRFFALLVIFSILSCAKTETVTKEEKKEVKAVEVKSDPNIFPIYSDVYTGGYEVELSHMESKPQAKVRVYIWEGTCKIKVETEDVFAGKEALHIIAGAGSWFGFGFHKVNPGSQDFTGFENGHLKFAIKAAPGAGDLRVLIKHGYQTESWLSLDPYGYKADGKWHEISIPLADFIPAIKFKDVNILLGMAQDKKFVPMSRFWIDEIYYTKN
ncbi:MAG: hypothetical protein N2258_02070 [Brevinematales bacterium]|nr:hypothetical protein [Brevinematales bacterium]